MRNLLFFLTFTFTLAFNSSFVNSYSNTENIEKIYNEIGLQDLISLEVFKISMIGFSKVDTNDIKKNVISIIDFSKPSTAERLFIINLDSNKVVMKTLVAHGKNTGENLALNFSNDSKSLKSSLGFYLTAETYFGKHGYSLKLDGLENGINDKARERAIVMHGANYVSFDFAEKHGRIGRSWGCPAIPIDKTKEIINLISGGSVLFIYSNDKDYLEKSEFIKI